MFNQPSTLINISMPFSNSDGAWHLAYYFPDRKTTEPFSKSLIQFKYNQSNIVDKWTALATSEFLKSGTKIDYVVRSLGHTELIAEGTGKPLDTLGQSLANGLGCKYQPDLIRKNRTTIPMHTLRKWERFYELDGVFYIVPDSAIKDGKGFLIIDDIITCGATTHSMRKVIKDKWPHAKVYFLVLGRTAYWPEDSSNDIGKNLHLHSITSIK
jgi:predicted amidophosphoribosyltransferase